MSFVKLFSKESKSSSESSTRKMNRGREVLRGKVSMRKQRTSNKKQAAEVIVYSATHDGKQPGQLEIFEEVNRTYQKPKKVVLLTEVAQPGVQGGSPCPSLSSSPSAQSPRNSFIATSPSSHSAVVWPFQVVTKIGEVYEFFVETPEDQKQWLKRLSLLIMFPYSPIPEEPAVNPIKDSFKVKLKAKDYNADSVWAVYILPEEVGSRVNVLGTHILTLKSRISESQPGQLSIISLADPTPIVTWDRDKMRRTGCLGNMVFVEIGRRCRGGPGLVWMYVGPKETAALRETLHMFLFKGDGRAVPISAQQQPPDPTRASFDSGFPPSYHKRGSQSSLQRSPSINTPQRQLSIDSQTGSDSGHHSSPLSHHQPPPPVDFDSHPNRQKRSAPRSISTHSQYENTDMDSGIASRRSSSSYRDSISSESYMDEQFALDPESSLTDSLQDEKFPAGSLEPDSHSFFHTRHHEGHHPHTHPPSRHYSIPTIPSRALHRSHSTSTCHPSQRMEDYERMIHPRQQMSQEGYIVMQPAQITGPESAMAQLQLAHNESSTHTPHISPPHTSPPRSLHPINEDKSSDYENYPLDRDIDSEQFTYYTPSYENIDTVKRELSHRRQSSDEPPPIIYRSRETGRKSYSPQNVRVVEHCPSLGNGRDNSPSPVLIPTP